MSAQVQEQLSFLQPVDEREVPSCCAEQEGAGEEGHRAIVSSAVAFRDTE
ncbi:hypothetical protein [Brevibacillus porteri]